ncbi:MULTISPECIES: TetR/AcrR family transcriptional regulator [unclassified Dietzia]|uniref:TetR/AcrR family transcriptional regulator n=1 Tax=unclassified Dietzia TaxID=2617939 RepID=UPI000D21DF42|nr:MULTISPECIES: TetR/AcrR family transcriptional regulator [unclassified Dietzia]AVZ39914.1 TetR family transcriptional regulator [Dietzia sp. JS16-p6b]
MSPREGSRTYAGMEPEERRVQRRRRFEEAIVEVIATEGPSAATVRRISATAGVGPRFFYDHFRDTDDLIISVYDTIAADLVTRATVALVSAPHDVYARAHAAVGAIVESIANDVRRGRFLLSDTPAVVESRRRFVHRAADALVEQSTELGEPLDKASADVIAVVVMAGASELVRGWFDGALEVGPQEITGLLATTLTSLVDQRTSDTSPEAPAG